MSGVEIEDIFRVKRFVEQMMMDSNRSGKELRIPFLSYFGRIAALSCLVNSRRIFQLLKTSDEITFGRVHRYHEVAVAARDLPFIGLRRKTDPSLLCLGGVLSSQPPLTSDN
jgi:hypothetical protein